MIGSRVVGPCITHTQTHTFRPSEAWVQEDKEILNADACAVGAVTVMRLYLLSQAVQCTGLWIGLKHSSFYCPWSFQTPGLHGSAFYSYLCGTMATAIHAYIQSVTGICSALW